MNEIESRIRDQFPALHVTFVSIMIGLVFEDLVSIVRDRTDLWPLVDGSLVRWLQVVTAGCAAALAWVGYSHIAIARRALPNLIDAVMVVAAPVYMFAMNSAIGGPAHVWFYLLGGFAGLTGSIHFLSVRQASREPELAAVGALNHAGGPLIAAFVGIPAALALGAAAQADLLSPAMNILAMGAAIPLLAGCAVIYFSRWRSLLREITPRVPRSG